MKHRFLDLRQVAFWDGQDAENEFKVTCEPLKHRFLFFTQVAFWAIQEEGNELQVSGDHLKRFFLDLIEVEFWACEEAENDMIAIRPLESSLYRLKKRRVFTKQKMNS